MLFGRKSRKDIITKVSKDQNRDLVVYILRHYYFTQHELNTCMSFFANFRKERVNYASQKKVDTLKVVGNQIFHNFDHDKLSTFTRVVLISLYSS